MKHLKRRRPLAWLGLLLAFALVVAACGDDDADPTTTEAAATTEATTTTEGDAPTTTEAATTTEAPDTGKPYGGEVIVADAQEPPTLNTYVPGGSNFIVSVVGNAYWTGVQVINGNTLELNPDLVVELPTVANGGFEVVTKDGDEVNPFTGEVLEGVPDTDLIVRYQIKDEAVWEDGTPITGEDFLFTYETIIDPDHPTTKLTYDAIVHPAGAAWCQATLDAEIAAADEAAAESGEDAVYPEYTCNAAADVEDTFKVDGKTVEFTMWQPTIQAELIFGTILPKAQMEGTDFVNDWNDTMWLSGGPFKLDTWQKGEFIKLVRNENYWGTDPETGQALPYLDSVVFRFIPESTSLINAFAAREVHVINPDPTPNAIERLQGLVPEGAQVEVLSGTIWEHIVFSFNNKEDGRFARNADSLMTEFKLRQAIVQAVDKNKIVDEILLGQVEPLTSYIDVFIPRLSTGAWDRKYPYDPDAATALVAELCDDLGRDCAADPISVVFTTTSNNEARVTLSELFNEFFTPIGIDYTADLEDSSLFFGESAPNGVMDLAEWAWLSSPGLAGLVSIHDVWDPENPGPDGDNWYYWGTPGDYQDDLTAEFTQLRDDMNATVDVAELEAFIGQAEEILSDALVFSPLYARLSVGAAWADYVSGVKHNPTQQGITWNIGHWYLTNP